MNGNYCDLIIIIGCWKWNLQAKGMMFHLIEMVWDRISELPYSIQSSLCSNWKVSIEPSFYQAGAVTCGRILWFMPPLLTLASNLLKLKHGSSLLLLSTNISNSIQQQHKRVLCHFAPRRWLQGWCWEMD